MGEGEAEWLGHRAGESQCRVDIAGRCAESDVSWDLALEEVIIQLSFGGKVSQASTMLHRGKEVAHVAGSSHDEIEYVLVF